MREDEEGRRIGCQEMVEIRKVDVWEVGKFLGVGMMQNARDGI